MPAVTRVGDLDLIHCSVPARAVGSPNVFVNSIPVSRQGDINTVHVFTWCTLSTTRCTYNVRFIDC